MLTSTVYLVTGASRGIGSARSSRQSGHNLTLAPIGLGIVSELAARADTIVFAGVRSPSTATALTELARNHPGKLRVVKLTSGDRTENDAALKEIESIAGRLDVVIANAGAFYLSQR